MSAGSSTPRGQGARHPGRWWLVAALVLLVAAVLLAWQPWQAGGLPVASPSPSLPSLPTSPAPAATSAAPVPTDEALTPTSTSVARPTPPRVPTGQFDATTAQGLFVTAEQLASTAPAAKGGPEATPVSAPWGLPAGDTVLPGSCLVARTVVATVPSGYAVRAWTAPALTFRQDVTLLGDAAAARTAFATLVETVDACPEYAQLAGDLVTERWTAQPAIEGQGLFPSLVQEVAVQAGDASDSGYRGHLLVGNAIVTWTARTSGPIAGLGQPDDLSAIVQDRALAAVRALG